MTIDRPSPTLRASFFDLLFKPENFVPLAAAYAVSMLAFGLVMLAEPRLLSMGAYSSFGDAHTLWGAVTITLGLAQLTCLSRLYRRRFWLTAVVAVFVWLWIAIAFLLSVGYVTTAQAMYLPASAASAWLALRTAPLTW